MPDRGGVAATVPFYVDLDVEIVAAVVGKTVGLVRGRLIEQARLTRLIMPGITVSP